MEPCKYAEQISETHKAIYGNGDPKKGLLWQMEEVRGNVNKNTEFIDMVRKHFWKFIGIAVLGSFSAFGNIILQAGKLFIRHVGQ